MKLPYWSACVRGDDVIVESPTSCISKFPKTDTRYTLRLGTNGYYVTTKPSYTACFLPETNCTPDPWQSANALHAALGHYFILEEEVPTTSQEKPKKYMRLPNSGTVVYLVDILSVGRATWGDHNGTGLFIQYPIGGIHISCGTIENAIADERALTEYLLSLQ